jgi:short-subunit dehydrogenase
MQVPSERGLAVVTGAAGGLGSAFATQLAQRGYRLLLVDRRQAPLDHLCESLTAQHGVAAEPCNIDLCQREQLASLVHRLQRESDIELVVNNAGFGSLNYFVDSDPTALVDMVELHVAAPVMITRAVLPAMLQRDRGAIINLSSVSAWLQSAGNVQYGATKCFLATFSLTLNEELRGSNVRVQALCPGFVRTQFHDADSMRGLTSRFATSAGLWMSADEVVRCSLRKLSGRQVIVVPGIRYSIFGRLAQMPVMQPLMRWLTSVPRLVPSLPTAADLTVPPLVEASGASSVDCSPAALLEAAGAASTDPSAVTSLSVAEVAETAAA